MTTKYRIYDTFNRRPVSNHRTLKTAVIAEDKYSRSVRRYNGGNSYIPTRIEYWDVEFDEWVEVPVEDVHDAEQWYLNA
jgi:hypothetical protein